MPLLQISNLSKEFLGVKALSQVNITVEQGELVGLIGPNGSGKTTLFNCITGFLPVSAGQVFLDGREITSQSTYQVSLSGITRTFQQIRVFSKLSVLDNLLLGAQQHQGELIASTLVNAPRVRVLEEEILERALDILEWGGLSHLREEHAMNLSYGQQKILSFLSALMPTPQLILLDEPAAAVNPNVVKDMRERILELNRQGQSFIVVEHNIEFIMGMCSRLIVLDNGEVIAEGSPEKVVSDPRVVEAYFGT